MYKKLSLIFIFCLAAMLLLVSCQRAASQPILPALATPTAKGAISTVQQATGIGSIQMIGTTQMIQTMTAMAQTSIPVSSLPTSTAFGTPNTFPLVPPTGAATTPSAGTTPLAGTTPVIIVPTSTPGHPSTYTLVSGDFPYCIARRFNVNQAELLAVNNLTTATVNNLQPGDVLQIPQSGNPFVGDRALRPHPGTYTVTSSDETINKVACLYGNVDPTQIIAANSLVSPYTLHFNQTLTIP